MLVPSGIHAKYRIPQNAESPCNPHLSRVFNPKNAHSIPRRPILLRRATSSSSVIATGHPSCVRRCAWGGGVAILRRSCAGNASWPKVKIICVRRRSRFCRSTDPRSVATISIGRWSTRPWASYELAISTGGAWSGRRSPDARRGVLRSLRDGFPPKFILEFFIRFTLACLDRLPFPGRLDATWIDRGKIQGMDPARTIRSVWQMGHTAG